MLSRKYLSCVLALFCIAADYSAIATYPQQPYPQQPLPPRTNPQKAYQQPSPQRTNPQPAPFPQRPPVPQPPYPQRPPTQPPTPQRAPTQPPTPQRAPTQPPYPQRPPNPPQQPFPQNPPKNNNPPYPSYQPQPQPQPQPQTTRAPANPWASICPNLNTNLAAKGKVSIKELNTLFVPALVGYVNATTKAIADVSTLKIPLNVTNMAEVKAFWTKFNASQAIITDNRRKFACYAMEELVRINSNGGQVDGASTGPSAVTANATITALTNRTSGAFNCTDIRDTALLIIYTNVTGSEVGTAMQQAYEDDSKCLQDLISSFNSDLGNLKFDNMNATEVKSTIEKLKLLVEPFDVPSPVGAALNAVYGAALALYRLARVYDM